jgi:serine/threonine protein kinase
MCEDMATCHGASVFHRDIKPENFIVTDGWTFNQDGLRERKVVVKLSDFGLSTCDAVLSDMDCGSALYMSFGATLILHSLYLFSLSPFTECRNNVPAPCIQAPCRGCVVSRHCPHVRIPFLLLKNRRSPVLSPAGFITTTLGWTRRRANARLSNCIVQIRPTFSCGDSPV